MPATAKVLRGDDGSMSFIALLKSRQKVALDGIEFLREFDRLDNEIRAKVGMSLPVLPTLFSPTVGVEVLANDGAAHH